MDYKILSTLLMGIILGYACANISGAKDTTNNGARAVYYTIDNKCIAEGFTYVGRAYAGIGQTKSGSTERIKNGVCLEDK